MKLESYDAKNMALYNVNILLQEQTQSKLRSSQSSSDCRRTCSDEDCLHGGCELYEINTSAGRLFRTTVDWKW